MSKIDRVGGAYPMPSPTPPGTPGHLVARPPPPQPAECAGFETTGKTSSSCPSKQRHTTRQHPIEGRIYYPFHPRCGETVLIARQYAYRGAELVVIPQPDGSVACIPAWMTHES